VLLVVEELISFAVSKQSKPKALCYNRMDLDTGVVTSVC
jgi:hypothetical protein